jgi:hypothetical protein
MHQGTRFSLIMFFELEQHLGEEEQEEEEDE